MAVGGRFDEDGTNSPSDAFVREQLAVNQWNHRDSYKRSWKRWQEYKLPTTLALMIGELFFYPKDAVQDFVYALSKRRSRNQWPEEVLERLRPDGPTTRLIELEREQGLPAGVSACSE